MPPVYMNHDDVNDDGERRSSSRRSQRSNTRGGGDGRGRRSRFERQKGSTTISSSKNCSRDRELHRNRSSTSLTASLRSHHALPQDFLSNGRGSPRSHVGGALLPPPPPRHPIRNTSFHSTSSAAVTSDGSKRGRSLSIARNHTHFSYSNNNTTGQLRRSKHGEDKRDGTNNTRDNNDSVSNTGSSRRGRSLSLARTSHHQNNKPFVLPPGRPLSPRDEESHHQPSANAATTPLDNEKHNRHSSSSRSRSRSKKSSRGRKGETKSKVEEECTLRESFKHVIAENTASSHHHHRSTRSSRTSSRSSSRPHSRSGSTSRSRSRSARKNNARGSSSNNTEVSNSFTSTSTSNSSSRKFVVEIGSNNEVVQVFEFSDQGSLPPKRMDSTDSDDTTGTRRKKSMEEELIETICRKYSDEVQQQQSQASTALMRMTSSSSGSSTSRKIVVDIDGHEVKQVFEYPSSPATVAAADMSTTTASSSSTAIRDESPFSRRYEAYGNENTSDVKKEEENRLAIVPVDDERPASPTCEITSRRKASRSSSARRQRRSASASRRTASASSSTSGGPLRSSLRSSLKPSRSVSFAMDNNTDEEPGNSSKQRASSSSGLDASLHSLNSSNRSLDRNTSDKSLDKIDEESRAAAVSGHQASSTTFMIGLDDDTSSLASSVGPSTSTPSKTTHVDASSTYTAPSQSNESAIDSSERSGKSSLLLATSITSSDASNSRSRSVSFLMDQQQQGQDVDDYDDDQTTHRDSALSAQSSSMASSSNFMAYEYKQQVRGRSALMTRSITDDDLPEVRRVRSLSRSHGRRGCGPVNNMDRTIDSFTINDTSSLTGSQGGPTTTMTQSRGREALPTTSYKTDQNLPVPPPPRRQTRSLSRTRHVPPIRSHVDFDPPVMMPSRQQKYHSQQQQLVVGNTDNSYSQQAYQGGALPYERVQPPPPIQEPLQKSMQTYSTAETFISALTLDTQDSFFSNHTSQAVRQEDNELGMFFEGGGVLGDPFMNSTLTIFESEGDEDEEESLLSDPTSLMDEAEPPNTRLVGNDSKRSSSRVYMKKGDDNKTPRTGEALKQEQRRSRIRKMLSLKASMKRKNNSIPSLDISEETRETLGTEGSIDVPECFMNGAQDSLLRHQEQNDGYQPKMEDQQHENKGSSSFGKRNKSRFSRLLHR